MRRSSERCVETTWVTDLFAQLEQRDANEFLSHVADNVHLTVMGSHPLAGVYSSKQSLIETVTQQLGLALLPSRFKIDHVLVAADTAVIEMSWHWNTKFSERFHAQFCLIARFESDMIIEARAYVDSALMTKLVHQPEARNK